MICVSLGRTRHKMMIAEHKALADRGAQLVELRLDWLSHLPDLGTDACRPSDAGRRHLPPRPRQGPVEVDGRAAADGAALGHRQRGPSMSISKRISPARSGATARPNGS